MVSQILSRKRIGMRYPNKIYTIIKSRWPFRSGAAWPLSLSRICQALVLLSVLIGGSGLLAQDTPVTNQSVFDTGTFQLAEGFQAELVYKVGRQVSGTLELEALLPKIVTTVRDAFDYYSASLMLVDEDTERLILHATAGGYADLWPQDLSLAIGEGMTGQAAATRSPGAGELRTGRTNTRCVRIAARPEFRAAVTGNSPTPVASELEVARCSQAV